MKLAKSTRGSISAGYTEDLVLAASASDVAEHVNVNGKLEGHGHTDRAAPSDSNNEHQAAYVRLLNMPRAAPSIESFGFELTRTKWDPYPWVCEVAVGTPAALCGLQPGDCILEVNGLDVLGLRIAEVSKLVKSDKSGVTLLLWNSGCQLNCDQKSICNAPMPTSLKRLSIVLQSILSIIECPVCNDTITPPAMQCQNGHLLCVNCRIRAANCPVCRDFYTPRRARIAEQVYLAIVNAFELCQPQQQLRHKLCSGSGSGTGSSTLVKQQRAKLEAGQYRSRQHMPLLTTRKYLSRLLQTRTYSCENLSETQPATLLSASSINNCHTAKLQALPTTSATKKQSPERQRTATGTLSPLSSRPSIDDIDLQPALSEHIEAPANVSPRPRGVPDKQYAASPLLFVGKSRPACLSKPSKASGTIAFAPIEQLLKPQAAMRLCHCAGGCEDQQRDCQCGYKAAYRLQ